MKIVVRFDISCDIIQVNGLELDVVEKLQGDFNHWINDENNKHKYWVNVNDELCGLRYRSDAFVEWLNNNNYGDGNAEVLESKVKQTDKSLPCIYF
jgi:hypothetical protein